MWSKLFLGTVKYPGEDDYEGFLSTHGGSSNAYTADEDTNYYFDVTSDYLEGALDRFAQVRLRKTNNANVMMSTPVASGLALPG